MRSTYPVRLSVVLLATGIALAGCGGTPTPSGTSPAPHVISGTFNLVDDATAANGCVGTEYWKDVHAGATVKIYEGDGVPLPLSPTLGEGPLGTGKVVRAGPYNSLACAYDFTIGVPDTDQYLIKYPGGLLLRYTRDELEDDDWKIKTDCCTWKPAK